MTQLKVKASSKPSTQNNKAKNTGPKPTTALGKFNHTFFEGSGVNQSIMMAGMAALGMGGAYGVVNKLMPTMRQAAGLPLSAIHSLWGKKGKDSSNDDTGVVSGAIAKNRATEASRGIRTLTKVTKKGFADVLKAMGAVPGQTKKKKSLWEMLTDAITGGGGAGGPKIIPGGGSILGWLVKNAIIMWGFNTINSNFRRWLGTEPETPQQSAARAVGDWVQGRYVISKTKGAYKSTVAAEEAARRLPALQRLSRTKKIAKISVAGTKLAARGVGLATAAGTSVYTAGLSFLVEEAIMNWIVDPIIDSAVARYIRWTLKPYELPLYGAMRDQYNKGGVGSIDHNLALHNMRLLEQAGGVSSEAWRVTKAGFRLADYALFTDNTQAPEAVFPDEVTPAQKEALEEKRKELAFWKQEQDKGTIGAGRKLSKVQNELIQLNQSINDKNWVGYKTINEYNNEDFALNYIKNEEIHDLAMLRAIAGLGKSSRARDALYNETAWGTYENRYKAALLKNSILGKYDAAGGWEGINTKEKFAKFIQDTTGYHDRTWGNQVWNWIFGGKSTARHITRSRPHDNPKNLKEKAENFVWDLEFDQSTAFETIKNAKTDEERDKLIAFAGINAHKNKKTDEKTYTNAGASQGMATLLTDSDKNREEYRYGADTSEFDDNLDILKDGGALDKVVTDISKAENAESVSEHDKDAIVHQETTDLISAENQVAYRLGELTSLLTGKELVTQGQSGNEKDLSPTGDLSSSLTLGGSPGAVQQYIAKIENLQTNYTGKMSELHV